MTRQTTSKPIAGSAMSRAAPLLQLALFALAVWLFSRAAIAFFAPESRWDAPAAAAPISAGGSAAARRAALDLSFDAFHRNTAPADEIIEIGTDAPETTLNLKLYGLRAGKNGSAILETSDRTQKAFRIGEEIMKGVTLKAVNPTYIVLSQGGRIERLTFERDSDGRLLAAPKPKAAPTKVSTTMTLVPQEMTLDAFMSGVTLAPAMRKGRLAGFRLTPKSSKFDLSVLDLKSGDIVSAIGDIDLTSPTLNPADIPAKLSGRSNVRLKVLRGTEFIYVTLGQ